MAGCTREPVTRWRALGGVLGPVAFVTAWAVLGARTDGYSPVHDPISRLAAVDASTRVPMTAGMLAYAGGVALFAGELRAGASRSVAAAAYLSALGTLAVAATPLDSALGGPPHAAAAGVSYAALGAMPLMAARPLAQRGHRGAAVASVVAGGGTLAALALSAAGSARTGLWQRAGLTLGDLWLVGAAAVVLAQPRRAGAP